MTHSPIGPSKLSRVTRCPWSLQASTGIPDVPGEAAIEGSTAHWGAEWVLSDYRMRKATDIIGQVCPETQQSFSEEMAHYVQVYVDYCTKLIHAGGHYLIENRVDIPSIHKDCYGTLDFGAWFQQHGHLVVVDFKYGYSWVDPVENVQLIPYASGLIDRIQLSHDAKVTLVIVQPRPYHPAGPIREWHTTAGDLRAHINWIAGKVEEAYSSNPSASPGEHCKYCPRSGNCPAQDQAAYKALDFIGSVTTHDCQQTPQSLSMMLDAIERARSLIETVYNAKEALGIDMVKSGQQLPGFEMRDTYERSAKWIRPEDEVIAFGKLMGTPLTKEKLMTPSEAKGAGLDENVIKKLSSRSRTGVKLKRTNHNLAQLIFSKEVNQ